MRLIDADELKKCAIPCEIHNGALTDLCVPLYHIDNAPTVLHDNYCMGYQDGVRKVLSERPQGDWIIKDEVICECSLCGYSTNYIRLLSPKKSGLNYCAYCGAKMERSDNE